MAPTNGDKKGRGRIHDLVLLPLGQDLSDVHVTPVVTRPKPGNSQTPLL
jgi:hypothetical protein